MFHRNKWNEIGRVVTWKVVLSGGRSETSEVPGCGLDQRFSEAVAIAREAGAVMARWFVARPAPASFTFKGPQDYITEADSEVENLVKGRLAAAFPEDSFLGEENGGRVSESCWVVDPIDGTANFARGIPHFCISIAYVRSGRIEIGIIYNPVTGEFFAARRGLGATIGERPLQVSGIADPGRALVEVGWSARRPPEMWLDIAGTLKRAGASVRRGGSGALGLAYVADGRIDAYCEAHINAWDVLAGLLLVQEAGGWANPFLEDGGLVGGNPVLACTPGLRDVVAAAMGLHV